MCTSSSAEWAPYRAEYARYYDGLPAGLDEVNLIKRYLETILGDSELLRNSRALVESALRAVQTHADLVRTLLSKDVLTVAGDAHGRNADLARARATQDAVETAFRQVVLHMLLAASGDIGETRPLVGELRRYASMDMDEVQLLTARFSDMSNRLLVCMNRAVDINVSAGEIVSDWPNTSNTLRVSRRVVRYVVGISRDARRVRAEEWVKSERAKALAEARLREENVEEECENAVGLFPDDY
jgi:hypothetical protein